MTSLPNGLNDLNCPNDSPGCLCTGDKTFQTRRLAMAKVVVFKTTTANNE